MLVRKLRAGKKARVRGYTDERTTTWTLQHGADDEPPKQITPLRLLKFGKPELPLVISATFLSAICAFLNMSQNFFVGWLVDIVRFSDLSMRQDQLNWITFVLLAIYIADALLALFSGVLYTIAASRCSCRLRSLVLRNMLRQDVAFFDTVRIGELLNRLSTDTEVIQSVVTSNLVGWFIPSVQVIIGFVICFWFSSSPFTHCLSLTVFISTVLAFHLRYEAGADRSSFMDSSFTLGHFVAHTQGRRRRRETRRRFRSLRFSGCMQVLVAAHPGDPLGDAGDSHRHVPSGHLHEGAHGAGALGPCRRRFQGRRGARQHPYRALVRDGGG